MQAQRAIEHLALAEKLAEDLTTPRRQAALNEFEGIREDLEGALDYFIENRETDHAISLVRALRDCWWESRRIDEGRHWTERVLEVSRNHAPGDAQAVTLDLAGALAYASGDFETARHHFQESLAIRRELGGSADIAQSLNHLAAVLRWGMGDPLAARPLMRESLIHARQAGAPYFIGGALLGLGTIATDLGDFDDARSHLTEAIRVFRDDEQVLPVALDDFAALAAAEGQPLRALCLAGAASGQHERLATFRPSNIRAWLDRYLALARAMVAEDAAGAAWASGHAMMLDEAIAYAIDGAKPNE